MTKVGLPEASIVRLFGHNDQVVGTGFLVEGNCILTCAHVVDAAISGTGQLIEIPEAVVNLDFPYIREAPNRTEAVIRVYRPTEIFKNVPLDIAFLQPIGTVPSSAKAAPLGNIPKLWQRDFRTCGFTREFRDGAWVSGTVSGGLKNGTAQLVQSQDSIAFARGFSGAPVWDNLTESVIGMVVQTSEKNRTAVMIATATIYEVLSSLNETQSYPQSLEPLRNRLVTSALPPESSFVSFGTGISEESLYTRSLSDDLQHSRISAESGKSIFVEVRPEDLKQYNSFADVDQLFKWFERAAELSTQPSSNKARVFSLLDDVEQGFKSLDGLPQKWLALVDIFRAYSLALSDPPQLVMARKHILKALPILKREGVKRYEMTSVLTLLATTYISQNSPNWEKGTEVQLQLLEVLSGSSNVLRIADERLALSTCLHMKNEPDWNEAINHVDFAISVYEEKGNIKDFVYALKQKAWIVLAMPQPDPTVAVDCYKKAVNALRSPRHRELRAEMLMRLAECYTGGFDEPQWENAEAAAEESVHLLFEAGSESALDEANALFDLYLQKPSPDYFKAARVCQNVLRLKKAKSPESQSVIHFNWAKCLENVIEPDWKEAIRISTLAVKHARISKIPQLISNSLHQLGFLYLESNRPAPEKAGKVYNELIVLLDKYGTDELRMFARHNLAFCLLHQKSPDYDKAVRLCEEAIEICKKSKDGKNSSLFLSRTYLLAAEISQEFSTANSRTVGFYRNALSFMRSPKEKMIRALTMNHLGYAYFRFESNKIDAIRLTKKSINLMLEMRSEPKEREDEIQWKGNVADNLGQLASLLNSEPDPRREDAIEKFKESLFYLDEPELKGKRANTLHIMAYNYWLRPDPDIHEARNCLRESLSIYRECGSKSDVSNILKELAVLCIVEADPNWEELIKFGEEFIYLEGESMSAGDELNMCMSLAAAYYMKEEPDWNTAKVFAKKSVTLLEKNRGKSGFDMKTQAAARERLNHIEANLAKT